MLISFTHFWHILISVQRFLFVSASVLVGSLPHLSSIHYTLINYILRMLRSLLLVLLLLRIVCVFFLSCFIYCAYFENSSELSWMLNFRDGKKSWMWHCVHLDKSFTVLNNVSCSILPKLQHRAHIYYFIHSGKPSLLQHKRLNMKNKFRRKKL